MKAARTSTVVGILMSVMVVGMLVGATPALATTTKQCYPASADADGDGYAQSGTASVSVSVSSSALKCPSGYVSAAGDCNDANGAVHPYHEEMAFNGVDDNCNSRVDEAKAEYSAAGNGNTTTGFSMRIVVKDAAILSVTTGLYAEVEVSRLVGSQSAANWVRRPKTAVRPVTVLYPYTTVNVGGLAPSTVYQARVRFYRIAFAGYVQVGGESDWYYTTTTGVGEVEEARTSMLLRGFKELDESNRGRVGYRGTVNSDGKRYGASSNEKWCSEFYVWVTKPYLNYTSTFFGLPTNVEGVIIYFKLRSAYHSDEVAALSGSAPVGRRGDYMPVRDKSHSTMLLGIDPATSTVWTLEGNSGNRVAIGRRPISGDFNSPDGLGHVGTSTL
jgi:hypothetical protein